ncbi:MAG: hypothetical protein EXR72_21655 [Myxococcales bacterium]|nr:hypothetical protein [Myxococcales bacterium]
MSRLNLTLDADTSLRLNRYARSGGKPRAAIARELLREGLARREAQERAKKLAADYAAGRGDARAVLKDLEGAQIDLLDDDEG